MPDLKHPLGIIDRLGPAAEGHGLERQRHELYLVKSVWINSTIDRGD